MLATIFCVSVFSYGQQYEKIQNRWKGTYINLEHGAPACTEIAPAWHSAMWTIERDGSDLKFKNRWKNSYLLANRRWCAQRYVANFTSTIVLCSKIRK